MLNEQIREKNQQLYSNDNNNIIQPKEEKDYSNKNKVGNYNYNFEGNVSPVYNRPSFIGRNKNERMINFANYQNKKYYSNIFMNIGNIEGQLKIENLEFKLKSKIKEEKILEKNWNLERKKNNDLMKDLEIQLIINKQLEKGLEGNIKYDIQDDKYQELLSKNNYLQKKFEEEINMNKEMEIIDNNEEEKKVTNNNYNNYYNNERYNSLEAEYKNKNKSNQFLEKELNEKYLKINNLQGLIKEEKYLYLELRQNLDNQKVKNQKLRSERSYEKFKFNEEKIKNQSLTQELEKERNEKKIMDNINKISNEIIKDLIKKQKKELKEKA